MRCFPLRAQVALRTLARFRATAGTLADVQRLLCEHASQRADAVPAGQCRRLELKWVWQANSLEKIEATPLVVDGVMYLTDPPNDVVAIDARTGRVFWRYRHPLPAGVAPCCGRVNRGLAMLGNTLYMGTLDAHLVALDAEQRAQALGRRWSRITRRATR